MKILILFIFIFGFLNADTNVTKETQNLSELATSDLSLEEQIKRAKAREKEMLLEKEQEHLEKIRIEKEKRVKFRTKELDLEKKVIDDELSQDNIWASQYVPYEAYQNLDLKQKEYSEKLKKYDAQRVLSEDQKIELKKVQEEYKIIEGKLSQLDEYRKDPFEELLKPIQLESEPNINNPLDIITALSYQKHLKTLKEEHESRYKSLSIAVVKLKEKLVLLNELIEISKNEEYAEELNSTKKKLKDFEGTLEIFETSVNTFEQKVSQININIDEGIEKEVKKSIVTGVIILFLLLFFFLVKFLITKYMSDNELFYGINKVINFVFIFLVFIILLFTYLENVENLMTILSFASAGIAIALKDWFMSLLGWVVILVSGSIHVGDRVKFFKDGVEYVGDIVDISVLRMTLHEDVTLTTVTTNKRSGRIIFIPNNYIFTDMIANYSHSGLKTVWDGIEFMITFDSNVAKAQHIAKEVTRKYSKGYTDMTRKQLNRLRSKYSMRNTAVEPRIFGFFDVYGVKISAWYLTNAYATLTLRSTISMEILARLQEEDDIHIALPSQSLYMDKPAPRPLLEEGEAPNANHRVQ